VLEVTRKMGDYDLVKLGEQLTNLRNYDKARVCYDEAIVSTSYSIHYSRMIESMMI